MDGWLNGWTDGRVSMGRRVDGWRVRIEEASATHNRLCCEIRFQPQLAPVQLLYTTFYVHLRGRWEWPCPGLGWGSGLGNRGHGALYWFFKRWLVALHHRMVNIAIWQWQGNQHGANLWEYRTFGFRSSDAVLFVCFISWGVIEVRWAI